MPSFALSAAVGRRRLTVYPRPCHPCLFRVVTQFDILPARGEQQIPRPANPSGAQKARWARDDSVALESGFKLSHYAIPPHGSSRRGDCGSIEPKTGPAENRSYTKMKALGVIPARYASTRLPGKPLVALAGKPMIEHVWERVRRAASLSGVVVATDDERIASAANAFGGEAMTPRPAPRPGPDRGAKVPAARKDIELFVNVKGDEPLIEPAAIDFAVE